jgi:hypothetical protein
VKTKYVTTRNGSVLHLRDCPHLRNPRTRYVPWSWAEEKEDWLIVRHMREFQITPCHTCRPIGELWTSIQFAR